MMLRHYLIQQADTQLQRVAIPYSSYAPDDFSQVQNLSYGEYAVIYFNAAGQAQNGSLPGNLIDARDGLIRAHDLSKENMLRTIKPGDGVAWRTVSIASDYGGSVMVAVPLTSVDRVLSLYDNIFIAFGILVVVAGGLAAWALSEGLFSPLRRAERQAAEVAGGNYKYRLVGENPNTELGRLNISLNHMADDIEHSFAARQATIDRMQRFVADASHELRTPLVSVRGYAELYRMGALKGEKDITAAMERIEKEAIRMGVLVEDLLALARLDEAKPVDFQPVDVRVLAHDAVMDARARDHDRPIEVIELPTVRPDEATTGVIAADSTAKADKAPKQRRRPSFRPRSKSKPGAQTGELTTGEVNTDEVATGATARGGNVTPIVLGVDDQLRQVFTNLLVNALRYTPEKSPIEVVIGTDLTTHTVSLSVRDHGDGIPPQIREQIFRRFWRADTSRTRETGGSGLGLSIVGAIVKTHKGTVTVEDTPGGGATFVVTLPLLEDATAEATQQS